MPKKKPSQEEIKRAADRAEGKTKTPPEYSPLDPPEQMTELDEAEELVIDGIKLPKRNRGGRPSKYRPEYARLAAALIKAGNTIPEIAEVFGISVSTVWKWRAAHPEFLQVFLESNPHFDARVEMALGQRAVGYDYDSVKVFQFNGIPVIVPIKVHVPPDVNASRFWLQARQNDRWKVKEEVEITPASEAFVELWKQMGGKKNKDSK